MKLKVDGTTRQVTIEFDNSGWIVSDGAGVQGRGHTLEVALTFYVMVARKQMGEKATPENAPSEKV